MSYRLAALGLILGSLAIFATPTLAVDNFRAACADIAEDNLTPSVSCLQVMQAYPKPVVTPIRPDRLTLSRFQFWKVVNSGPTLYDTPNGNPIGQMPAGFNFIHALDATDGWVLNGGGQWMTTEDLKYQPASEFRGVQLLGGLENPFGWVLGDLVTSPEPGAKQSLDTGTVKFRYDLVNIFAEVRHTDGWLWYMVGPDQWIEQRSLAIPKLAEKPADVEAQRWVGVDLYEQTLVAYEGETPVYATLIASGLPGWDTNEGLFDVWARVEHDGMSGATGAPDAYALESVPWVMYFDGGISLHGTYWHDGFGYRRSHGCVNLSISDAGYVFNWFKQAQPDENGEIRSQVYVWASGEYHGSGPATK
ncbi:MAG: L,D-transpeptidase [Anaerolineae bacterium]|nr:L,D-transpeptidase [Anaerolineae bacterium]